MDAKKQLATELITRFHDAAAAESAAADFAQRFQRRELPSDMQEFAWAENDPEVWICHLLRETGLTQSTSEARRMVQQGAVRVDTERIENADLKLQAQGEKVVQVGRRRIVKVVFSA